MARGPRARAQRRRSGRRHCRAGPGVLVPGRPMNDRPGAAPVPGGADTSGAGLTAAGAGTGHDAGAELAGAGLDTNAGLDATGRDAGTELNASGLDAEPGLTGVGLDTNAG